MDLNKNSLNIPNSLEVDFNEIIDGVFLANSLGVFTHVNHSGAKMIGYEVPEITGKPITSFIYEGDLDRIKIHFETMNLGQSLFDELKIGKKDGSLIYIELSARRISDGNYLGIIRDITYKKTLESSLKESERKLKEAQKLSKIGHWDWDFKKSILSWSDEVFNIFEVSKDNFTVSAESFEKTIHPDDLQVFLFEREKALSEGNGLCIEHRIIFQNGLIKYVLERGTVIKNSKGESLWALGTVQDITDIKTLEKSVLEKTQYLDTILNTTKDGFWITNAHGKILDVNRAYCEMSGYTSEELLTMYISNLDAIEGPERIKERIKGIIENKSDLFETKHIRKDGSLYDVEISVSCMTIDPLLLISFCRDISKRKQSDVEIEIINERLKLATKAANVGIWEYDIINSSLVWDDGMYNLYGVAKDTFSGAYEAWENGLHPDDLENARIHSNDAIEGRRDFNPEFRVVWQDGSVHYIKANAVVLHNENGLPVRMIGTNWDITDRVNHELALLNEKHKAKVANIAKSQFLANMSHEIRTPMNGIMGFLELLNLSNLSEEQKMYVNEAKAASGILIHLINDILDLSKVESGKLTIENIEFNLFSTVEESISLISPMATKKNINLNLLINPDVPKHVIGDPAKLRQVLNNLISNAVKFTQSGKIDITVNRCSCSSIDNLYIKFGIKDTGIGIEEDVIKKLFNPFVQGDGSTTRKYGGTGLGLAISKELVNKMGGDICVVSKIGEGSTFSFTIKFNEVKNNTSTTEYNHDTLNEVGTNLSENENQLTIKPKILLVEDNEINIKLFVTMLRNNGFGCDVARDGIEGLNACNEKKYDIVFMDCQMPKMDGYKATKKIRELEKSGHHTIIIAITADAMEGDIQICLDSGMDDYISKPLEYNILFEKINKYANINKK